ncbi:MAG: TRAP transporter small permease subunit [Deltaproteobacteria bacterium]|nr:TRAP transporter small permease subunit [Deltaproteobacteria bacterium]
MLGLVNRAIRLMDKISLWMIGFAALSLVLIMVDEVINAIGRKFGVPLPCALELAVSLMISSIFLAVSRVASIEEHTFVTMTTRMLPRPIKRGMDCFGYLLGVIVFGIISVGAWEIAYDSLLKMEMQIGVFRFPIWPFRIIFALGVSLLSLQLLANAVRAAIQIAQGNYPEETVGGI